MKVSIIDIGTQSLKHYIFEVKGNSKQIVHYKRYSEANLGESDTISGETIVRNLNILKQCLETNQLQEVSKLQILGTEILRRANNAHEFTLALKDLSGHDVEVISHDMEAQYLYEGFVNIIPDGLTFAAMNIGGGSTEVVIGDKDHLVESKKIPFGTKFLKKTFNKDGNMDWRGVDSYLAKEISFDMQVKNAFVTGVLDFISTVGPHLGFVFEENDLTNHPIRFSLDTYVSFLETFRNTSIEELRKLYPKDPGFADGFTMGQSVYVAVARALSAKMIIPSNNDLTDGVVHRMVA